MTACSRAACPGVQLTWMDARVDGRVITPRIGKPVEIQALWINALRCAGGRHAALADRAQAAFAARFWNSADRMPLRRRRRRSRARARRRAACGPTRSSPWAACRHASSTATTAQRAWWPSSSANSDAARPAHAGAAATPPTRRATKAASLQRDGAYHQGTVWPWLIGPFVDAWLQRARRRRRASRGGSAPLPRAACSIT